MIHSKQHWGCTIQFRTVGPVASTRLRGSPCTARALRAQCALLLDYVPPKEPLGTPLGNTLRIRRPKLDWRGP